MRTADEHLEEALKEYNQKVSDLESNGTREEMLEALVNRSTILLLMESYASSLTDLEDASELIDEMKFDGEHIDTGTLVKFYENRGQLSYEENNQQMVADYSKIAGLLDDLRIGIRHYDLKGMVCMCIGCAEDLIDQNFNENSIPFIVKGLELISDRFDTWASNRRVELYTLSGQARGAMGLVDDSYHAYTDAINIGAQLYKDFKLEDELQLVMAFVNRGDISESRHDIERMMSDNLSAIDIMEQLNEEGKLDDRDLLVSLHQSVAQVFIKEGRMPEAEKHLLRAMKLGLPEIGNAIDGMCLDQEKDQ